MLKLTLKPGQYIDIGDDIRVVFSGGSANNAHFLIDAPKDKNIVRSNVASRRSSVSQYYAEPDISEEARQEIVGILRKEKKRRQEM